MSSTGKPSSEQTRQEGRSGEASSQGGRTSEGVPSGGLGSPWEVVAEGAIKGLVLKEGESFDPVTLARPLVDTLVPQAKPEGHDVQRCLGRLRFDENTEQQLNNAVNVAYGMSYAFHSMANFFNRDCIALPGLTRFFLRRSDETRATAILLSHYINQRGGRVVFKPVAAPHGEYAHEEKGDALYAMELTVAMEKAEMDKFLALNKAAEDVGDQEMSDFVTDELLHPLVGKLKLHAEYVSQLRRVGKGHGHWDWDEELYKKLT